MAKWQLNEGYREIAVALRDKFPELRHVNVGEIVFVDNLEAGKAEAVGRRPRRTTISKPKSNSRVVYAQVRKIPRIVATIMQLLHNSRYQYILEVFKVATMAFSREKLVALLYHELRHIDASGALLKHEIEDWRNITDTFGANWGATQRDLPDLLDASFNWDQFDPQQQRMFPPRQQAAAASGQEH